VPGVLVEDNKRRKIVQELGGEVRGDKTNKLPKNLEEEKKEPVSDKDTELLSMVSQTTEKLLKENAEKEKTQALSMIPDKYRIKETSEIKPTSTALSLVNALATN
jgi:hypothetical protein